jgi:uncharacterized membrane protein YcaP (DUF421 family)
MESILRAASVYVMLLIVFRIAGRRALSEMTSFDFVLILIIGDSMQQALLGDDFSLVNAMLVIVTLLTIDVALSLWKQQSDGANRLIEGVPTVLVEHGRPLKPLMDKARVREDEILEAARRLQGLERMDQIKFAVLEVSGGISIIPNESRR